MFAERIYLYQDTCLNISPPQKKKKSFCVNHYVVFFIIYMCVLEKNWSSFHISLSLSLKAWMVSLNSNWETAEVQWQREASAGNFVLVTDTISALRTTARIWAYISFTFRIPTKVRGNLHEAEKCNSIFIHLLENGILF